MGKVKFHGVGPLSDYMKQCPSNVLSCFVVLVGISVRFLFVMDLILSKR